MAERRGRRLIPMNSFFVLPKDGLVKENVLQPGELITEILRCAARRDPLHLSECARARLSFSDIRNGPSSVLRQANSPGRRAACFGRHGWFWQGLRVHGRTGSVPAIE
jgi:hypothetical protein